MTPPAEPSVDPEADPKPDPTGAPRILYCRCAYAKVIEDSVKDEVLQRLGDAGVAFDAVADLCEMAARKDPALDRLRRATPVRIAACYPRAVRWLFHGAGFPLPDDGIEVLNMRERTAEDVADALLAAPDTASTEAKEEPRP